MPSVKIFTPSKRVLRVWIPEKKRLCDPQCWFVECAHGDGPKREAATTRRALDRAHGVATDRRVAHPFYEQLNRVLEARDFDEWVERQCAHFYAEKMGRPSLAPGRYFRLLLIGYFEGIDSERGIAWRAADSLGLRSFLGVGLNEMPPDHSTISRTRRLIGVAVRFIPKFAHTVTSAKSSVYSLGSA
jgi:hypothetical protein